MGSCGEDPNKGIDSSVGGLVWVRRRNGSWWPGRIVGPDELPEGCVPTPRAGTPVKLLGREDASVDWYNLEKSKRVKPFRCGEYGDCIQKAKESASHVSKKAVKYARREEAILHALRLESVRLGKDYPDFSNRPDPQDDRHHRPEESPSSVHPTELSEDLRQLKDKSESALELSRSGVSFEEPNMVKEEPNDPEDGGTVKHMRGLENLGMGAASSPKGKRSPVARANELSKRRHRRRTLTKVLECTEAVPAPDTPRKLPSPTSSDVPGVSESKEFAESEITNSVITASEHAGGAFSVQFVPDNESSDVPRLGDEKNTAGLPIVELNRNPEGSGSDVHIGQQWQLKGKRNARSRKPDVDDEAEMSIDAAKKLLGAKRLVDAPDGRGSSRSMADISSEEFHGWVTLPQKLLMHRQSRLPANPKYVSDNRQADGSGLYDVAIVVETSHRPQYVPYISLMSKIYGRPVIGHPLSIEVLDDGFCDELLRMSECHSINSEHATDVDRLKPASKRRRLAGTKPWTKSAKSKKNPLLSKKIRRLSSLTLGGLGRGQETKKPSLAEKLKLNGPTTACVPLNVVFSRINAALNGGGAGAPGGGSWRRVTVG